MVNKGLIERFEEPWGNKTIIKYKVSEKRKGNPSLNTGAICSMFPRGEGENS
jgi:hypothetical protein